MSTTVARRLTQQAVAGAAGDDATKVVLRELARTADEAAAGIRAMPKGRNAPGKVNVTWARPALEARTKLGSFLQNVMPDENMRFVPAATRDAVIGRNAIRHIESIRSTLGRLHDHTNDLHRAGLMRSVPWMERVAERAREALAALDEGAVRQAAA